MKSQHDSEISNTDEGRRYTLAIENDELQLIENAPNAFASVCGSQNGEFLQMTVHWLSVVLPTSLKKKRAATKSSHDYAGSNRAD